MVNELSEDGEEHRQAVLVFGDICGNGIGDDVADDSGVGSVGHLADSVGVHPVGNSGELGARSAPPSFGGVVESAIELPFVGSQSSQFGLGEAAKNVSDLKRMTDSHNQSEGDYRSG